MGEILWRDLAKRLQRGQATVLVGAGATIAATGHTSASWPGLLRSGIERCVEIRPELAGSWNQNVSRRVKMGRLEDFLYVGGQILQRLGGQDHPEVAEWLRDEMGRLRPRDTTLLESLRSLGCPLFTTNYDTLLEEVCGLKTISWDEEHLLEIALAPNAEAVLHLHGVWKRPESIVLDAEGYRRLRQSSSLQAFERSAAVLWSYVLVGCGNSGRDPNIGPLRGWIERVLRRSPHRHYWLLDSRSLEDVSRRRRLGRFFYLSYGEHSELPTRLLSLKLPGWEKIPPPAACFQDRPFLYQKLIEAMKGPRVALVGVAGDGGVGKTQLAAHYIRSQLHHYGCAAWVDVRDRGGDTISILESLVAQLEGQPVTFKQADEGIERLSNLLDPLVRTRLRSLLVFDNADNPDDQLAICLDQLAHIRGCHVLVTTRKTDYSALEVNKIFVGSLERSEAINYLRTSLGGVRAHDSQGLEKVAEHEGFTALWLSLAVAKLLDEPNLSLDEYCAGPGAFSQLRAALSQREHEVLVACAACAQTGFSPRTVTEILSEIPEETAVSLERLRGLRLVETRGMILALHPRVRELLRSEEIFLRLAARHVEMLRFAALLALEGNKGPIVCLADEIDAGLENSGMLSDDVSFMHICQAAWRYQWRVNGPWNAALLRLNQARAVAERLGDGEALSNLEYGTARIYKQVGHWDESLAWFDRKRQSDRERGDPLGEAAALVKAAYILRLRDRLSEAQKAIDTGLSLQRHHGEQEREIALTLVEQASLLYDLGRAPESLAVYDEALEILRRLPAEETEVHTTERRRCRSLAALGREREALVILRRAVDQFGKLPAKLAATLAVKGGIHLQLGEFEEARECFKQGLATSERLGDPHWEAECRLGLGELLLKSGQREEAASHLHIAREKFARVGMMRRQEECKILLGHS